MSSGLSSLDSNAREVTKRVHAARDQYIASISHDDVLTLAASYHPGTSKGRFFREPVRGSYNICYFVQFPSALEATSGVEDEDGERWTFRIPLPPRLGFDPKEKVESEVATLRLLSARTTIPVPKVIAYALGDGSKPIDTFLILQYMRGEVLQTWKLKEISVEQKQAFYKSLADIYLQLRRLEFPTIGCLTGTDDPSVGGPRTVFSIDINEQEISGRNSKQIQEKYMDPEGGLRSALAYTHMLLDLGDNALQGQSEVTEETLYNMHMFREFALGWLKPEFNQGPFVLIHGDFDGRNILIDESYNIIGVLDWEWSHTVPLQFFTPPLWLRNFGLKLMANRGVYSVALGEYDKFLAIVRAREKLAFPEDNVSLADEWEVAKPKGGFYVPHALEMWVYMDWFAHYTLHSFRGNELKRRVEDFMSQDERRRLAVETKKADATQAPQSSHMTLYTRVLDSFQGVYYRFTANGHHHTWGRPVALTVWGTASAGIIVYLLRWWNSRR